MMDTDKDLAAIEELLIDRMADLLRGVADNEIDRLVSIGWSRSDAALFVEFSPSWPIADEHDCFSGIMCGSGDASGVVPAQKQPSG